MLTSLNIFLKKECIKKQKEIEDRRITDIWTLFERKQEKNERIRAKIIIE